MKFPRICLVMVLMVCCGRIDGAGFLEKLGILKRSTSTNSTAGISIPLSQEEIAAGLKQALSNGVERAVAALGKTNGFLKDAEVRIPIPPTLQKVERALRTLGQEKLADEFITTMNRAAEEAVPEAGVVLGEALKNMTINDAKNILIGTNNAATEYFRRVSETNLFERFVPIVRKATEKAGVTSAYKNMTAKARGGLGAFGDFLGTQAPDLDSYITKKTMDGLFLKIAEQEKLIRENPSARATEILRKVFGAIGVNAP